MPHKRPKKRSKNQKPVKPLSKNKMNTATNTATKSLLSNFLAKAQNSTQTEEKIVQIGSYKVTYTHSKNGDEPQVDVKVEGQETFSSRSGMEIKSDLNTTPQQLFKLLGGCKNATIKVEYDPDTQQKACLLNYEFDIIGVMKAQICIAIGQDQTPFKVVLLNGNSQLIQVQ